MRLKDIRSGRKVAMCFGLLSLLAVVGCERPTTETTDYRVQHKVTAEERVFTLKLDTADAGRPFEADDKSQIRQFAREYLRRGRGPFFITRAEKDGPEARRNFNMIAAVVAAEGVPGDRIYFQVRRGAKVSPGLTRLSFSGYTVRLPKCGDWSGETGFAPSNRSHSDYGCSYQRNIGLMLANPGDLAVSREEAVTDARRTDYLVGVYQSGSGTFGRKQPTLEEGNFSSVK